jgi:hypothetical protein
MATGSDPGDTAMLGDMKGSAMADLGFKSWQVIGTRGDGVRTAGRK